MSEIFVNRVHLDDEKINIFISIGIDISTDHDIEIGLNLVQLMFDIEW